MYQALLHKCQAVRAGLCLVCLGNPLCDVRKPSPHEQEVLQEERDFHYYLNPKRRDALAAFYPGRNLEDCLRIFDYQGAGVRLVRRNGILQPAPLRSAFYNFAGGRRRVAGAPERWRQTLHVLGDAPALGLFAPDEQTVASRLQAAFNAGAPESVRVLNAASGGPFIEAARQILSPRYPVRPGDLIVLLLHEFDGRALAEAVRVVPAADDFMACIAPGEAFQRPHSQGEVFFDARHMGPGGYALLADYLFPLLLSRFAALAPALPAELAPFAARLRRLRERYGAPAGGAGALVLPAPLPADGPERIAGARAQCELLYVLFPEECVPETPEYAAALAAPGVVAVPSPSLKLRVENLEPYFSAREREAPLPVAEDQALFTSLIAPALGVQRTF